MSRGRWIVLGAALGFAVALTQGAAYAAGRWSADGSAAQGAPVRAQDRWAAMDGAHDSPWMEQARDRMGRWYAAECDRLHDPVMERAKDRDRVREHAPDETGPGFGPDGMMGGFGPGSGGMMAGSGSRSGS